MYINVCKWKQIHLRSMPISMATIKNQFSSCKLCLKALNWRQKISACQPLADLRTGLVKLKPVLRTLILGQKINNFFQIVSKCPNPKLLVELLDNVLSVFDHLVKKNKLLRLDTNDNIYMVGKGPYYNHELNLK